MSVLTSEAVVLRTWPVHEADLLVSFFTRDYGRLKGMAKAALKSRKRFGGALEPMTLARAWFAERPRQELVRLDQLEILRSPLSAPVDQARMAVLSFYAEVIDEALPERDPQATVFRLLASVLEQTSAVKPETAQPQVLRLTIRRTAVLGTLDGADVFLAVDDAADGIAAGHRTLHGVRGCAGLGRSALQRVCGWAFLRAARERVWQRALGRLVAIGAADAEGAGGEFCRRGVAAEARAGSAAIHAADA